MLQAILLGFVQGVTEFLPISSSGHLILLPRVFDFADQGLAVDAVLHLATALAIFVYFRQDWWDIFKQWRHKNGLLRKIAIASLPAIVVGLTLGDLVATVLRSEWVVVVMLISVAGLMWWVERNYTEVRKVQNLTSVQTGVEVSWIQAVIIGLAQSVALIPGTSRSGVTIVTGMWQHLPREQAARFSFLLGAPIALGAGLMKGRVLHWGDPSEMQVVLVAGAVAFVTALLTMHWLLKFLRSHTLRPFIWYRLILALTVAFLVLV